MPKRIPKLNFCEHCGREVKKGSGGLATIPLAMSHRPEQKVWLHNACLNPYLYNVIHNRPPLPMAFSDDEIERAKSAERTHS